MDVGNAENRNYRRLSTRTFERIYGVRGRTQKQTGRMAALGSTAGLSCGDGQSPNDIFTLKRNSKRNEKRPS